MEELSGSSALELLIPRRSENHRRGGEELIRGEAAFSLVSFRGKGCDGAELHGEALLWVVQSGDDHLFVGSFLDVTEEVMAQRKLAMIRELGRKAILLRDIRRVA